MAATQSSSHLPVRLPGFPVTAAVQQVLLCPTVHSRMSLCRYGRHFCYIHQGHLEPLALAICCPAPSAVQVGGGSRIIVADTTSAQGGFWYGVILQTQRGAASCIEVVHQDSLFVLMCRPRLGTPPPRVSYVPCVALVLQTAPGMNTHRQLGETPLKVGQADGRPCGE